MPRSARIDAPGALHHIIARGIARHRIFNDGADRNAFLERLGNILKETDTACYAWALMRNHFHLLLKTGPVSMSTVMRRLLTGYAMDYNRRHGRSGHLFQNRYKSILCQEETYFLALVRYIHLNPLRAQAVSDLRQLDNYRYAGHSVLMGNKAVDWQNVDDVLTRFASRRTEARKMYRQFVQKEVDVGRRPELTGGGLVRSMGGWSEVKALRRANTFMKGDERILGDSEFVQSLLERFDESCERRFRLKAKGLDLDTIARSVSKLLDLPLEKLWSKGKHRPIVAARSLVCYFAVNELDMSMIELARRFEISTTAISKAVQRGKALAVENDYTFENI